MRPGANRRAFFADSLLCLGGAVRASPTGFLRVQQFSIGLPDGRLVSPAPPSFSGAVKGRPRPSHPPLGVAQHLLLAVQVGLGGGQGVTAVGHSSAVITWSIYQHVVKGMQGDAAERVSDLIFGAEG